MSEYKTIRHLKVEIRPTDVPMGGCIEVEIDVSGFGFQRYISRRQIEPDEFKALFDEYFDTVKEEIRSKVFNARLQQPI